ncbi:MAG: helix-turn-helix transcriptional regulator [Myxococcales bacterium]|nr:helix-turn-helix transcriptional regulator [Myxococcales bacterium]
MIKNDRQYRITKAQADGFERALAALAAAPADGVSPAIRKAQLDATRSQLEELQADLAEYDALRTGKHRVLELTSLTELPRVLIQARIASGMTQKELAERLGLQEQAIQRYEATNYTSASLARINDVVKALGLVIREEVFLPTTDTSLKAILKRLKAAGVDQDLVEKRLLPSDAGSRFLLTLTDDERRSRRFTHATSRHSCSRQRQRLNSDRYPPIRRSLAGKSSIHTVKSVFVLASRTHGSTASPSCPFARAAAFTAQRGALRDATSSC